MRWIVGHGHQLESIAKYVEDIAPSLDLTTRQGPMRLDALDPILSSGTNADELSLFTGISSDIIDQVTEFLMMHGAGYVELQGRRPSYQITYTQSGLPEAIYASKNKHLLEGLQRKTYKRAMVVDGHVYEKTDALDSLDQSFIGVAHPSNSVTTKKWYEDGIFRSKAALQEALNDDGLTGVTLANTPGVQVEDDASVQNIVFELTASIDNTKFQTMTEIIIRKSGILPSAMEIKINDKIVTVSIKTTKGNEIYQQPLLTLYKSYHHRVNRVTKSSADYSRHYYIIPMKRCIFR